MNEKYVHMYMQLVLFRKFNKLDKSTYSLEAHHITPRFYFRNNALDIDNSSADIVMLTHDEHILAHYYLYIALANGKYKDLAYHAYISMASTKSHFRINKIHKQHKTIRYINIRTLAIKIFSKDVVVNSDYMPLSEFKNMKRKHIHNINTNKNTLFPVDLPLPAGYVRGYYVSKENSMLFSQKLKLQHMNKTINNKQSKNKGKIRVFNIKTLKIFFIQSLTDIPADCIRYSVQKYQQHKAQKSKIIN